MRDISLVIEQILEIIPEARNDLKPISDSTPYVAPEAPADYGGDSVTYFPR